MPSPTLRPPRPDERPTVVAFIGARNIAGAQLCLHLADQPEAVDADLAEVDGPLIERCLVAEGEGGLRGVIAWDVHPRGHRCWLLGPWVEPADDAMLFSALLAGAMQRLPSSVERVDNFLEQAFTAGIERHRALGFAPQVPVHIFANRPDPARDEASPELSPGLAIAPLTEASLEAVIALHDEGFPGTHTSITDLRARGAETDQQLVATLDGQPVGYLTTHIGPEPDEAHIEYLAVTASARRRGIGRALLRAGLRGLFTEKGMASVFLTVHSDNDRALALYRSVGFESHSVGVPLSWTPAQGKSG